MSPASVLEIHFRIICRPHGSMTLKFKRRRVSCDQTAMTDLACIHANCTPSLPSDLCIRRVESELSCLGTFQALPRADKRGSYRSDLKMAFEQTDSPSLFLTSSSSLASFFLLFLFLLLPFLSGLFFSVSSCPSVCVSYLHNPSSRESKDGKRDWAD